MNIIEAVVISDHRDFPSLPRLRKVEREKNDLGAKHRKSKNNQRIKTCESQISIQSNLWNTDKKLKS